MKTFKLIPFLLLLLTVAMSASAQKKTQKTYIPWNNVNNGDITSFKFRP